MSFIISPDLVPDGDSLPLKKREQRLSPPQQLQQLQKFQELQKQQIQKQQIQELQSQQLQQLQKLQKKPHGNNTVSFKEPYPYKNHSESKPRHTGPFRPVPRRAPALHQPWIYTPTRTKQLFPAFREHHGWVEWREFNALSSGWDHYQHLSSPRTLHPGHPHHSSRFSAVSSACDGFSRAGGGWEKLQTCRDPDRLSYGKHKSPYARREDKRAHRPPERSVDVSLQHDSSRESAKAASACSPPGNNPPGCHGASSERAPSPNRFPWLLPHFVAGSLIELRDGRLRKVEHLQTEDFLLGSLACPDLHLSCCTVQSISASASSVSRLLVLLHEQQSQEVVEVYEEYPFFVRGRGWSSCSPQRTAHLCGLRCRQLTVGDVCLALTPASAPRTPPTPPPEPKSSPRKSEGGCEKPLKAQTGPCSQARTGAVRRRHCSAP